MVTSSGKPYQNIKTHTSSKKQLKSHKNSPIHVPPFPLLHTPRYFLAVTVHLVRSLHLFFILFICLSHILLLSSSFSSCTSSSPPPFISSSTPPSSPPAIDVSRRRRVILVFALSLDSEQRPHRPTDDRFDSIAIAKQKATRETELEFNRIYIRKKISFDLFVYSITYLYKTGLYSSIEQWVPTSVEKEIGETIGW